MGRRTRFGVLAVGLLLCGCAHTTQQTATIPQPPPPPTTGTLTVRVDQPGIRMSPTFYGLMTEEINHSYDGGLYGELIENRVFEDPPPPPPRPGRRAGSRPAAPPPPPPIPVPPDVPFHWSVVAADGAAGPIITDKTDPVNDNALKRSLRLDITSADTGKRVGVSNDGYWGFPIRPNTTFRVSFYARAGAGFSGPLTVDLESRDGATVYATAAVDSVGARWKKYNLTLTTGQVDTTANARFVISAEHTGSVWFSLVSLFPPTFNDRPNGNRIDLMQLLGDMHPDFLRLPGGNYVEGDTPRDRFAWENTIGPLEDRPGHQSPWRYRSSDGFGLLEFLEWCEDLHMQPVLAVYAGYALRGAHVVGPELQPYVQEALDEIEYVTGDQTTQWGRRRAADGHADPFKLTYVEIGNEDQFDRSRSYDERFTAFHDAIKAKYPDLQLIATTTVTTRTPDVVDDHYYRPSLTMQRDAHHYDVPKYHTGKGPKIFVGEWASREGNPTPTLWAALGDGAWLTGLERDSDVVVMQCYAPLLVDVNPGGMQWPTDLIGFDTLHSYGSPSYYVQKMFSVNRGDSVVPSEITMNAPPTTEPATRPTGGLFVSANRVDATGEIILKVVNSMSDSQRLTINLSGAANVSPDATAWVLTGQRLDQNSVQHPTKVAPVETDIHDAAAQFTHEFPALSVSVIRIKTR